MQTNELPPRNIDAEKAVLGSLIIDSESIYKVRSFLKTPAFFSPENQYVYDACLKLCDRGEEINTITVAHELASMKKLEEVGSASYLAHLVSIVPTSLHIEHYARIVLNTWIQRCTVSAGSEISGLGQEVTDTQELLSKVGQIYLNLQQLVAQPQLLPPKEWATKSTDRYLSLGKGKGVAISTGISQLDWATGGIFPEEFWVVAGDPRIGKTTLATQLAENFSVYGNILFCSLEMPYHDITDRRVSMRIGQPFRVLRSGKWNEEVEKQIMGAMGEIAESSIYYFGQSASHEVGGSVTTQSIYATARYMKMAYGLSAIVVDYLQAVGDDQGKSSYERVSGISRRLQSLAKSLSVPVVTLCQLNRQAVLRADRRPRISDLRDCLAGDTEVFSSYGIGKKINEINSNVMARANTGGYKKVRADIYEAGIKPVYKVRTELGFEIKATMGHRFFTPFGFRELRDLKINDSVAICGNIKHSPLWDIDKDLCRLLGYLLGDGGLTKYRSPNWCERDNIVIEDFMNIIKTHFPEINPKKKWYRGAVQVILSKTNGQHHENPIINWLKQIGVWGQYSHEREIPSRFLYARKTQLAQLLKGLFTADGSIRHNTCGVTMVTFDTNSEKLCNQVRIALTKFGIVTAKYTDNGYYRSDGQAKQRHIQYRLSITSVNEIKKFIKHIGFVGKKQDKLLNSHYGHSRGRVDYMPHEVNELIRRKARAKGLTWQQLGYKVQGRKRIERQRFLKVAEKLEDDELKRFAQKYSDIAWLPIRQIKHIGEEMTYDMSVEKHHNFIANHFLVHNSGNIEYDADVILLIYRDVLGEDNSIQADEAEIEIGKQRQSDVSRQIVKLRWDASKHIYYEDEENKIREGWEDR